MPELPEVETIVRDLDPLLRGFTIHVVDVLRPDLIDREDPEPFARSIEGSTIRGVTRRAKNIVADLGDQLLLVNLGMTGRLGIVPAAAPPPLHLGVRFGLRDGRSLLYQDVRRFGRLWRMASAEWERWDAELGWEPLDPRLDAPTLAALLGRSRVAVKSWLMDQRRVVGIGNIYASEALFRAGIDPRRPANTLSIAEAERLLTAVRETLRHAIDFRGTTLSDYRDARGERGGFASELLVYGRGGEPCRRCATPIERLVQGGRSTFFCSRCQPPSRRGPRRRERKPICGGAERAR